MKVSASRIILYSDCSLKYKFRYIDKIDKFSPSIHLAYGTAVHAGLEYLGKSSTLREEEMLQVFHDTWHKEIKKHEIRTSKYTDRLYEMGINTLLKYYGMVVGESGLKYETICTEKRFEIEIPELEDEEKFIAVGVIDVVLKDGKNLLVVDYKTAKAAFEPFKMKTSVQLPLYSYAFRKMLADGEYPALGKKTKEDYIAYYVFVKDYENLDGEIQIRKKKVANYDRLFYILKTFKKGTENEIFIPNYESINCKWCEYKKECLEFKK